MNEKRVIELLLALFFYWLIPYTLALFEAR